VSRKVISAKNLQGQTVKASNGVSLMAAMFLIILDNDISKRGLMPMIQREFRDCLPDFNN